MNAFFKLKFTIIQKLLLKQMIKEKKSLDMMIHAIKTFQRVVKLTLNKWLLYFVQLIDWIFQRYLITINYV